MKHGREIPGRNGISFFWVLCESALCHSICARHYQRRVRRLRRLAGAFGIEMAVRNGKRNANANAVAMMISDAF